MQAVDDAFRGIASAGTLETDHLHVEHDIQHVGQIIDIAPRASARQQARTKRARLSGAGKVPIRRLRIWLQPFAQ